MSRPLRRTEWTRMGLWSLWEIYGNYSCGISIGNLSRSYWTYCIQFLRTKTRLKKSEVTISYPRVQKVSKIRRHPRHWNSLHHRLWEFWDQVWASCVHIPVFSSHDQASVALFIKLPHTAWQLSNSPWVLRKSAKALKDRGTILSSVHQSRIIMNNVDTPRWRFPKMGGTLIIQIRLFSI
jgi:hypothetical protein